MRALFNHHATLLAASIEEAAAKLSPGARTVFLLHDVEGYTHEEIATQLGITLASLALGWIGEPAFHHLIQPIFTWGLVQNARMAAEHGVRAAQAGVDVRSTEVALRVKQAYWGVVTAHGVWVAASTVGATIPTTLWPALAHGVVGSHAV